MENETSTTPAAPSSPPAPAPAVVVAAPLVPDLVIKPGMRTTEFWITAIVIIGNHISAALRSSASPSALIASYVVDGVAAAVYAIARALVKRGALVALALLVALAGPSCAHLQASAKACAGEVTPDLTATAAAALARDDWRAEMRRAFAGVAACLVAAAVDAAIDQATHAKLAGAEAAETRNVIKLHGDAWKAENPPG